MKVVGIIIGFFACLIGGAYFIIKRKKQPIDAEQTSKTEGSAHSSKLKTFIWMVVVSFISSLISAGYTGLVFILTQWMQQWYYTNSMFVTLLLLVFSLGVYALVIVGPAIFMGMKRGVWSGVGTFFMILLWFMMYIFIGMGFYMINRAGRGEIYPQPLMYQNEVMKTIESATSK